MKKFHAIAILILTTAAVHGQPAPEHSSPDPVRFMVFSDPHYYDPSLGTEGKAFQAYLDQDRKLLKESRDLLLEAIARIEKSDAQFVVVPGDLTKDGTLVSHTEFATLMKEVEKTGKQVYVIPGNHDILNGESFAFRGDTVERMPTVTPEDFARIHGELGYNEALYRDSNSLSYVVEPAEGLWLLGLDACLYRENDMEHHPVTDGRFLDETLDWIDEVCARAADENKLLLAFMHHGVLEHYEAQEKFFGEYVVDNHKKVAKKFSELGIKVVFTGHYHAQDITVKQWDDGRFIFDVETGSLVTWPCPIREVSIAGDSMYIRSQFITGIPTHEGDFEAYSRQYAHEGIAGIAEETMVDMKLKREDAAKLSGQIGDAFLAHYRGDEASEEQQLDLEGVGCFGRFIILFRKRLVTELHSDLPPADNDLVISLKDGEYREL